MSEELTVLIVDDEEMLRMTLRAMFEDLGYRVVEAGNGRQGLQVFARERPALVFTDLSMPEMDGFALIKELARLSPGTPVVVISGVGLLSDAIEALRLGAWDYVTKPVARMEEIEIATERVMERARLVAENRAYRERLEELVRQRTEELCDSEERYRTLFESAGDAIMLIRQGGIVACNRSARELFACPSEKLCERPLVAFTPAVQPDGCCPGTDILLFAEKALAGEPQFFEWHFLRQDGSVFCAQINLNSLELRGEPHLQAIIRDITEHKRFEERLYRQANYDTLTGLPSRYLLTETLTEKVLRSRKTGEGLHLMLLDLDHFDRVNDTLGHALGDELLRQMAGRLQGLTHEGDLVARFMGDQFVVVATGLAGEEAGSLALRISSELHAPFFIEHHELFLTVSIGLVDCLDIPGGAEALLGNAEAALHEAQKGGGGRIVCYTAALSDQAEQRFTYESRLHRALEREEFVLHYQPQIDVASRRMSGVESLIRWAPPGGCIVAPDRFVPIMEEIGLIIPVGEWVLRRACAQHREWTDAGVQPFKMSVNISVQQFRSGRLPEMVRAALDEFRVVPSLLCLELTESIVMCDIDESVKTLRRLVEMGVSLSVDDFGTGYSSLSYLRRMPINELKVDRSFVVNLPADANCVAIVNTILAMAEGLNLAVVAEGVETRAQLDFLAQRGCGTIQGYLFSRPVAAWEIPGLAHRWGTKGGTA